MSAWICEAEGRTPWGPDREPGTADDDCEPVVVDWRLADPGQARLNKTTGHKVMVQLTSLDDNRIIATYADLERSGKLTAKPRRPDPPTKPGVGKD